MGSKRFDTERSEVENLVCMYVHIKKYIGHIGVGRKNKG